MDSHSMVLIIAPLEDIKLGSKIHVQCVKRGVGDFTIIINNKYWNVCWGRRLVCLSRNLAEGSGLITITVLFVPGLKRSGCEINQWPHVVPKLRMSGAKPLLPLYHFTAYTGATLFRKSVIYSTVKLGWCVFICVYMYVHYYTNIKPDNRHFRS